MLGDGGDDLEVTLDALDGRLVRQNEVTVVDSGKLHGLEDSLVNEEVETEGDAAVGVRESQKVELALVGRFLRVEVFEGSDMVVGGVELL